MYKFTTQEIIDMGAELFDKEGFSREQISKWLHILINNGCVDCDFDSVFDLIVG